MYARICKNKTNTERFTVSKVTAGAVVDVYSPTGLRSAIITNIDQDNIVGVYVKNTHHYVVLDEMEGTVEDVIAVHDGERGVVIGQGNQRLLIFKDEDGLYVAEIGNEGNGRFVKSAAGSLKVACDYLRSFGQDELVAEIKGMQEFYLTYLNDLLQED